MELAEDSRQKTQDWKQETGHRQLNGLCIDDFWKEIKSKEVFKQYYQQMI